MRLKAKAAIVTGVGSGIGRATACLFAKEGAYVIGADVEDDMGEETTDLIRRGRGEATYVHADVSDAGDVKSMIEMAIHECGRLDILHNNAGIYIPGTVEQLTVEEWDKTISVNLRSVFLGCKYAIPHMISRQSGVVINTASVTGLVGFRGGAAYIAAKGGVVALTRAMALDCAPYGVRVNAICPGVTDTQMWNMWRNSQEHEEDRSGRSSELMHPMHRVATADEIAAAALYLASDESSFVTGIALPVDGGLLAQGDGPRP